MAEKKTEKKPDLVTIGLVVVGGFVLWRFIKNAMGPTDTGTSVEAASCGNIWTSGGLSRDKTAYAIDADEIYTAIIGSGPIVSPWEDDNKIAAILMRANNQKDVDALICAFGYRKGSFLSPAEPLTTYIISYLDSDKIEEVNNYYQSKGISTRW